MAKNINSKKTWKYPEKYKLKAIKLSIQPGVKVKDVAAVLEKENARLRQENDLLKKWQRFLGEQHQKNLYSSRETDTLE